NVQNLTPEVYSQLNIPDKLRGVVITSIESGSPSETALMRGDVILEINRKAIADVDDYEAWVSQIESEQDVLLLIFRRGSTIFVTLSGE
ncbi:MAG: PDZ domain-containing protein, partial [Nitrospiraceae bacterium]